MMKPLITWLSFCILGAFLAVDPTAAQVPPTGGNIVHGVVVADLARRSDQRSGAIRGLPGNLALQPLDRADIERLREMLGETMRAEVAEPSIDPADPSIRTGRTVDRPRPVRSIPNVAAPMIREDQRLEVAGEGSGLRRGRPYPFIALPDIALRLIDLQTGAEVAQTQSDVHGVYDFPEVPPARYKLCWEAEGWLPGCWQKLVSTADGPAYVPPIGIKPARSEGRRAVAGRVLLGDGKPCRFVDIRAGIDLTAEVHAVGPAGRARRARANSLGYYVVPDASAGLLQLLASCRDVDASRVIERVELASAAEGAPKVYFDKDVVDSVLTGSGAETLVFGPAGPDLVVDFQIANRPPQLLDIIIVGATGGAGRAAPGETVILRAAGGDATPTALFWTVPGGEAEILPNTGGTALEWVVPETQGQYRIEILGGDGFGGWGRAVETIEISDSESLRFGGRVFAGGKPAAPAAVRATVNGRMLTVAAGGFFSGLVPPAPDDRYVLNIEADGFRPVSRVFHRQTSGGVYDLVPARTVRFPADRRTHLNAGSEGPAEGTILVLEPESLVREGAEQPYQGQVVATLSYIDPSRETLPGDYDAVGLDGRDQALISYGAVYADFKTPQGDALQLGSGRRAQLTLRVPADRTQTPAMLPALMPVWTYNPATGYWEQEPELATRSGVSYTTEVRHFSTINMDLGTVGNAACVRVEVDFLKTPEDRILQVSTPIPTGGTQVKEATLDEKLNAVFRLLPGSTATFALKRADGTTFSDFTLLENGVEVPGETITLISPADDMQGADLWPDSPFDDCRRLVLVSGDFDAPVDFLNRKDADSVDPDTLGQSEAYYAFVDPDDLRTTFEDWLTVNGFDPQPQAGGGFTFPLSAQVVSVAYLNHGDLGSGRKMHCRKDSARVAGVVGNYVAAGGVNFDRDPAGADVAGAATSGTGFATVAMEYATIEGFDSAGRVVKFFTYAPNRVTEAALDQVSGARNQPQVCMVCHGGRIPATFPSSVADVGALSDADFTAFVSAFQNERSSFREFDLGALRNLQGSNPENNVRQLNCDYVLDADPWDEVQNLILGWYGGTNDCDGVGSPVQSNYNPWTSDVDVYDQVVANSCRTCHVAQESLDFSDPTEAWNAFMIGQPYTCSLAMPQAAVAYNSYHIEGRHDFMQTRYGPC